MLKNRYYRHHLALVGRRVVIGEGTRIWAFANIQDGAVIGRGCNICDGCFIEQGAVIGDNVTLKNGVNVFEGVTLEDDVFCGANVAFTNDRHPRSNRKDPWVLEKTLVRRGVSIGSNATILCGLTLDEFAVVGAGSVVTKNVGAYQIVTGNPARLIGYACRCGRKLSDDFKCPACRLEFIMPEPDKDGKRVLRLKEKRT